MAASELIHSLSSKQAARRHSRIVRPRPSFEHSPPAAAAKLDLLRELLDLNQAFERVNRGLERMEKVRFFRADLVRYARAEVETARVEANSEFFEHLAEVVEHDARWAYKFRRAYDRKTEDPFDFYLHLQEREEERKKKGLPPRAVLLPGWDQDDEDVHSDRSTANKRMKAPRKARPSNRKWPKTHRSSRRQTQERKAGP